MEIESLSCVLLCPSKLKPEKLTQSPLHTWHQSTNPLPCRQQERKYERSAKVNGYQEDPELAWDMTRIQRVFIGLKIY